MGIVRSACSEACVADTRAAMASLRLGFSSPTRSNASGGCFHALIAAQMYAWEACSSILRKCVQTTSLLAHLPFMDVRNLSEAACDEQNAVPNVWWAIESLFITIF